MGNALRIARQLPCPLCHVREGIPCQDLRVQGKTHYLKRFHHARLRWARQHIKALGAK